MISPRPIFKASVLAAVVGVAFARVAVAAPDAAAGKIFRFQGEPASGEVAVAPAAPYSASRGFGFESPTAFSVQLPEGNYRVEIELSDGLSTVKAEARRVLAVDAGAGKHTFYVNARTPRISGDTSVKLNGRETGSPTWDDRLSIEVLPNISALKSLKVTPADVPTVYLAGDSTVTDQAGEPWAAWGQILPLFLKDVAVSNHAESGRALRSFRNERRLEKILSTIKMGDYLFIQFGHNDQKEKGEGVGALTTYKADLEKYVAAAKEKGATPVLVTPMYRRRFDESGKMFDTLGDYPKAVRLVAQEQNVVLIDLHKMSFNLFSALGPENSKKAFVHYPANTFPNQDKELKDDTHFNAYGGYELARCVAEAIRTSNLPLAANVQNTSGFDPSKPDPIDSVHIAPSQPRPAPTPEGN